MRKLAFMAVIAASPLMLAACGKVDLPFLPKSKAQLLMGEWSCTASDMPSGIGKVTMEFDKDDKLIMGMKGDVSQGGMTMSIDADVDGSYRLKEKTLTLRPEAAHVNSIKMNGQPVDLAMMGGKQAVEQQMASGMSKGEFEITRLDKGHLELTEGANTTKCER